MRTDIALVVWCVRTYLVALVVVVLSHYISVFAVCNKGGHLIYLTAIAMCLTISGLTWLRKGWVRWTLVVLCVVVPSAYYAAIDYFMELRYYGSPFDIMLVWVDRLKWAIPLSLWLAFDRHGKLFFQRSPTFPSQKSL